MRSLSPRCVTGENATIDARLRGSLAGWWGVRLRLTAEEAEQHVLEAIKGFVLPPDVLDAAREELARRLKVPPPGLSDGQRARLRTRLENLRKQHEWGDLTDDQYRSLREEVERQLILLPDHEKLVSFERHRQILVSMAENVERATPAQLRELIEILVERVDVAGREVREIRWTPAAVPFFDAVRHTASN